MLDASGRWVITFNGEIYNYLELRAQLEAAGATFRGRTDTEVLLNALALWGTDALARSTACSRSPRSIAHRGS